MNVEYLINLIYERPEIWDKNTKEHSNRNTVDKAWKEIVHAMEISEPVLRKKWKSLRDYFIMEYHKRSTARQGDDSEGTNASRWLYYKHLLFLRDQIAPKLCAISLDGVYDDSPGRTELLDESSNAVSSVSADDYYTKTMEALGQQGRDAASPSFPSSPKSPGNDNGGNNITPDLKQPRKRKRKSKNPLPYYGAEDYSPETDHSLRLKYFTEQNKRDEDEDADVYFWKSLLPYIKQIPEHLQLSFRHRIQLTVEEFAFGLQDGVPCKATKDLETKCEQDSE